MTNYERIKAMSVEKMAEFLYYNLEYLSAEYGDCSGATDSQYLSDWLNSEVEE
nr:MAG TPA: hypothetical protein [Bacteriophage sp.]